MSKIIKKRTKELVVAILILSLLGWFSLIKPVLAGNLSNVSDTLSDSRPTEVPTHTIIFTMESGTTIANTETVTVQFTGFTTGATVGVNGDWTVSHDADGAGAYTDLTVTTDYTITQMATSTANPTVTFTFTTAGATAISTDKYMKIVFTNGAGKLPNPTAGVQTVTIAGDFGDTGVAKVSIISGVTVSVSVAETLTFTVNSEDAATCAMDLNSGTEIDTTATTVPFGSTSGDAFVNGCQRLDVGTNATDGYTTTVLASDLLTSGANTIAEGTCDSTCTDATEGTWETASNNGLGYCMDEVTGDSVVTADSGWTASAQCGGGATTQSFKVFKDQSESEAGHAVMQSAVALSTDDQARIGYRISVAPEQAAGDYENVIIFVTTPQYD